ncbi:SsrA-binding protein SmpB [Candidatus Saccharibacteria bacterium]|nr:SsrA-binding protein SmpB [Candidatus Saccharibacteria bacterium]MCB9821431.1 SsrA-binding protein SmpB [Candidatus Nomurabacteria bacterium]
MAAKHSKLVNTKARFDYELQQTYEAGIVLLGAEVASIRAGRLSMRGSFVTIRDGEAWLNNLQLSPMPSNAKYLPENQRSAPRKLLLKRNQLEELIAAKQNNLSIVPTKLIPGRYIKIQIAVAKGKKQYDKRAIIKARQQNREAAKSIKRAF